MASEESDAELDLFEEEEASTDLFEELQEGNAEEALTQLDTRAVKTLLNVIRNVLDNTAFKERISRTHRKVFMRNMTILHKLMSKSRSLKRKKKILQKTGHVYLPAFLEIVGDELEDCIPRQVNRVRKDCPVCGKENLLKLSNHLSRQHGITGEKRKELLKKTST